MSPMDQKEPNKPVEGGFLQKEECTLYKINNYDSMPPFFMTLTNSSDHWAFISTSGGLTAGRKDANNALFPYYTDDKITENAPNTGHRAVLIITHKAQNHIWEPFANKESDRHRFTHNIYKSIAGNRIIFEETHTELGLTYQLEWTTSPVYGFLKKVTLINQTDHGYQISLLDGIQNTLPTFITSQTQNEFSNLLDGYKRNELHRETGLGIYALSARLTDLAEPSESLSATTWWNYGLEVDNYLLSNTQVKTFIHGQDLITEEETKGRKGAYLVHSHFFLEPKAEKKYYFCGEVNQSHKSIFELIHKLQDKEALHKELQEDLIKGEEQLYKIIGLNDGLQCTNSHLNTGHHLNNIMFNLMRGGYFAHYNRIDILDFDNFLENSNKQVRSEYGHLFPKGEKFLDKEDLEQKIIQTGNPDLLRLFREYLPLTFSRRHGDPSRPWNHFAINTQKEDGSPRLDYQGNWRDIFQNWEALLCSNPQYILPVISKFLNATTADGYNPYRISKSGIDWERPEPGNPWANIGYWSDHQIIYLCKLLELSDQYYPQKLGSELDKEIYVFANVPYKIKAYKDIKTNPRDTIIFDYSLDESISHISQSLGSDGKLLQKGERIVHANMVEKLLILVLAKMANFVPDGGIWMNTQRPEWNDANNALAGYGLSLVTLSYLIRFIKRLRTLMPSSSQTYQFHEEVALWLDRQLNILEPFEPTYTSPLKDTQRAQFLDQIEETGSDYREQIYKNDLSSPTTEVESDFIHKYLELCNQVLTKTLSHNKREDGLFHSYNRIHLEKNKVGVKYLYEMLEGQVSAISSEAITPEEGLTVLEALKKSSIYREDQHSYMLYPNRSLPSFLQKNTLTREQMESSPVLKRLLTISPNLLINTDLHGQGHFNREFRNEESLISGIKQFNNTNPRKALSPEEEQELLNIFEGVFQHKDFTGRSGTFFAYEGLGSIYWHMVSKLLLATQELLIKAYDQGEQELTTSLMRRYKNIRSGLGYHKTPQQYGAFPIDPYSHTPWGSGAKQPGMTGQVKEEILTRWLELGLQVQAGQISFNPILIDPQEYLTTEKQWVYYNREGVKLVKTLQKGSFGYTFCNVPIIVTNNDPDKGIAYDYNGQVIKQKEYQLPEDISENIFNKTGQIKEIIVKL
ncbi:hypothetical protein [Spirochaeta cellobiosiphila]|uniref:hypothetical protein n=1 Tax=Spirochaeta cellobiosiphila TaxID=504483 RepID=UPI00040058A9|nr:hypothetical protein [Spirochaeta cellobiosiphila]